MKSQNIQNTHQQCWQDRHEADEPWYLVLACEAALMGMTREHGIASMQSRLRQDERYLAYRKASGRHTSYDDQVQADMLAMALAICFLEKPIPARNKDSQT